MIADDKSASFGWQAQIRCGVVLMLGLVAALLPAAASQRALVSWNGSTDTNVVAYDVYYGGASGQYTNVISVGNVTNTIVSGLLDGATYYFAAKARSSS